MIQVKLVNIHVWHKDADGNSGSAILTMQEGSAYYPQPVDYPYAPGRKLKKRRN